MPIQSQECSLDNHTTLGQSHKFEFGALFRERPKFEFGALFVGAEMGPDVWIGFAVRNTYYS